jgi:hypothetical protein
MRGRDRSSRFQTVYAAAQLFIILLRHHIKSHYRWGMTGWSTTPSRKAIEPSATDFFCIFIGKANFDKETMSLLPPVAHSNFECQIQTFLIEIYDFMLHSTVKIHGRQLMEQTTNSSRKLLTRQTTDATNQKLIKKPIGLKIFFHLYSKYFQVSMHIKGQWTK